MSNLARWSGPHVQPTMGSLGRGELIDWSDVNFFEAVASELAPTDFRREEDYTPYWYESQISPQYLEASGYRQFEDIPTQQLLGALPPQGPKPSTQKLVITAAILTVVGAAAFYFFTKNRS